VAGEGVNASIHGTTVAASALLPQAQLLPLDEKSCAELHQRSDMGTHSHSVQRVTRKLMDVKCFGGEVVIAIAALSSKAIRQRATVVAVSFKEEHVRHNRRFWWPSCRWKR